VNYGVRPDGTSDFPSLPEGYAEKSVKSHYRFWQDKQVPSSWIKFRDIALYWTAKGVDGFRFDMAEMVPVEFWSYMNSAIKNANSEAFLLAEVYNPSLYRDYIHRGKMDYLYDKVALYDTLKSVMQGWGSTDHIPDIYNDLEDIEHHMLHFLENHDEQRIASPEFAGDAMKGKPAMVLSTTISTSPTMLYFGQEVGEAGALNSGFGSPSRTSIFDYCGVPAHQRWMNEGAFDGGQLSENERDLRAFYKALLNFTAKSSAMMGQYAEVHTYNRKINANYSDKLFSFIRWDDKEAYLIICNFDATDTYQLPIGITADFVEHVGIRSAKLTDQLDKANKCVLKTQEGGATVEVLIHPLESFILKLR
jgi:glycosidase